MPDVEGFNQQAYAVPELDYDQINMGEPVSLLDRMHNFFDSVVERAEALPVPSRRTALGLLGASSLIGTAAPAAIAETAASAATAASSLIVPGQGEAGIKLGDTTPQVTKLIGSFGGKKEKKVLNGSVGFNEQAIVIEMYTKNPNLTTSQGIHVGSSLSAVRAAYPQAKRGSGPDGPDYSIAGTYRGKKVLTSFYTIHGSNVAEIEVCDKRYQLVPGFGFN